MSRLADDLLVIRKLRRDLAAAEYARRQAELRQAHAMRDGFTQELHAGVQLKVQAQRDAGVALLSNAPQAASIGQHLAAAKQADVIIAWRRAQVAQAQQVCVQAEESVLNARQTMSWREKGLEKANTFKTEDAQGQAREHLKQIDAQEQESQEYGGRGDK